MRYGIAARRRARRAIAAATVGILGTLTALGAFLAFVHTGDNVYAAVACIALPIGGAFSIGARMAS